MKYLAGISLIALTSAACATQADDVFTRDEKVFLKAAEHGGAEALTEDGDKVICRREHQLGTRVSKSVCMTKAEWDSREANSERFLDDIQNRNANVPDPRGENPAD